MGWFAAFLGTGEGSKRRCEVRRVARDFNGTGLRRRVHDLRESLAPHSKAPRCLRRRSVLRLPRPLPNASLLQTSDLRLRLRRNGDTSLVAELGRQAADHMESARRDTAESVSPTETVGITSSALYRAAWASSLGSALEYYDFALYSLASALVFAPLFFPEQDPAVARMASFGTYFLGFAVRPVGGIIVLDTWCRS